MKAVKTKIGGNERLLLFNGAAMFAINENFGQVADLIEEIEQNSAAGFNSICKAAAILMEQAELARRYYGYKAEDIITEDNISLLLSPAEVILLKAAIVKAVVLGFGREIEPGENEIDLDLVEIEAKKINP